GTGGLLDHEERRRVEKDGRRAHVAQLPAGAPAVAVQPDVRQAARGVPYGVRDVVVAGVGAGSDPALRESKQLCHAALRVPDLDLGLVRLAKVQIAAGGRPRGHGSAGLRVGERTVPRLSYLQLRSA